MSIVALFATRSNFTLTVAERQQFHAEQINRVGFAGLKPVRRIFVEV